MIPLKSSQYFAGLDFEDYKTFILMHQQGRGISKMHGRFDQTNRKSFNYLKVSGEISVCGNGTIKITTYTAVHPC